MGCAKIASSECNLCARHRAKWFAHTTSFSPYSVLWVTVNTPIENTVMKVKWIVLSDRVGE